MKTEIYHTIMPVINDPSASNALKTLASRDADVLEEQIRITQIPAPTFDEALRGRYFLDQFKQIGLQNVSVDKAGNVIGEQPGTVGKKRLVVSAHLDTVFSKDTDLTLKRDGDRYCIPGIADNGRGLAVLLALARALKDVPLKHNILYIATAGEEGLGDLYGVKHLFFESRLKNRIDAFLSIDGTGFHRIVNEGLGSKRLRITFSGPGGHSWGDFGTVNPAHAMGRAIAAMMQIPLSTEPKTTLSVGTIRGGTSVNAIPVSASLELDMRSTSEQSLNNLEQHAVRAAENALAEENRSASSGMLNLDITVIGNRPTGKTDPDHPLVRAAIEATEHFDAEPVLLTSSTDANIAMSLGIPAITIGGGGKSGSYHTPAEWYSDEDSVTGLQRAALIVMLAAGIEEPTS